MDAKVLTGCRAFYIQDACLAAKSTELGLTSSAPSLEELAVAGVEVIQMDNKSITTIPYLRSHSYMDHKQQLLEAKKMRSSFKHGSRNLSRSKYGRKAMPSPNSGRGSYSFRSPSGLRMSASFRGDASDATRFLSSAAGKSSSSHASFDSFDVGALVEEHSEIDSVGSQRKGSKSGGEKRGSEGRPHAPSDASAPGKPPESPSHRANAQKAGISQLSIGQSFTTESWAEAVKRKEAESRAAEGRRKAMGALLSLDVWSVWFAVVEGHLSLDTPLWPNGFTALHFLCGFQARWLRAQSWLEKELRLLETSSSTTASFRTSTSMRPSEFGTQVEQLADMSQEETHRRLHALVKMVLLWMGLSEEEKSSLPAQLKIQNAVLDVFPERPPMRPKFEDHHGSLAAVGEPGSEGIAAKGPSAIIGTVKEASESSNGDDEEQSLLPSSDGNRKNKPPPLSLGERARNTLLRGRDRLNRLRPFINQSIDLKSDHGGGATAVSLAAANGYASILALLLDNGSFANPRELADGTAPLMHACKSSFLYSLFSHFKEIARRSARAFGLCSPTAARRRQA